MRVLVAMSGGVDSSVAAARLVDAGHDVVGATMKLWGGPSDNGCCSVGDVEDARQVADQLGIEHHVFNFTRDFSAHVVDHYVSDHALGHTPNPCVECNRRLKFDRFLDRATRSLSFDAIATGHHARVVPKNGRFELRRGADPTKDQSYVLSVLGQGQLARSLFPVGDLIKARVRELATERGLHTAAKRDSQEVCFISSTGGREAFLSERIPLHRAPLVDSATGSTVGSVDAVELVTLGQRKGLGLASGRSRRYALSVDTQRRRVVVGPESELSVTNLGLERLSWVDAPLRGACDVLAQCSAHGNPRRATYEEGALRFHALERLVAPGQTVAIYDAADGERVLGAGVAVGSRR